MPLKETIAKINKTKTCFFEKINFSKKSFQESFQNSRKIFKKIDKPLTSLLKKKREKTQINKIRNEKGEIIIDAIEIQGTIRYC